MIYCVQIFFVLSKLTHEFENKIDGKLHFDNEKHMNFYIFEMKYINLFKYFFVRHRDIKQLCIFPQPKISRPNFRLFFGFST